MRVAAFLLSLSLLSCSKESINPPNIKVSIGEPFQLAASSQVTINESNLSFKLEKFGDFEMRMGPTGYGSIQTKMALNENVINLVHQNICDWPYLNCSPYYCPDVAGKKDDTYGGIVYCEYMPLNENLKLTFRRVTKSTLIKEYSSGGQIFRVDSAEFIIEQL